jgi:hypothetical protein
VNPADRLDFEGDYGRTYARTISHAVPGYDTLHELALTCAVSQFPQAAQVLVMGPGPGEELIPLLCRLPQARLTVVEPSGRWSRPVMNDWMQKVCFRAAAC